MDVQKNTAIFFPIALEAMSKADQNGNMFAYYTTADVAYQIIKNKEIWMRSTMVMNDYMEIEHGSSLLINAKKGAPGEKLRAAVDACHPGLFDEVWQRVVAWLPGFRADTFITCISEHDSTENKLGRLSMWRAYGGRTGVAFIINGAALANDTDALGAYASPVSYFTQDQFSDAMTRVATNIDINSDYVRSVPTDVLKEILFRMFRFAVLCTKHPGFAEEREWRIVASPALQQSNLIKSETAVVRGVPQLILKIPLQEFPEQGVIGLSIPALINSIIIGPCEFPHVTFRALWTELRSAGVEKLQEIIVESEIPLRHS
jgi:hypothetical protein